MRTLTYDLAFQDRVQIKRWDEIDGFVANLNGYICGGDMIKINIMLYEALALAEAHEVHDLGSTKSADGTNNGDGSEGVSGEDQLVDTP